MNNIGPLLREKTANKMNHHRFENLEREKRCMEIVVDD